MTTRLYAAAFDAMLGNQAGKGEARHGQGKPFMAQPWYQFAVTHGLGFLTGQAHKKWDEANTADAILNDNARYCAEVAGALAYACMALVFIGITERRREVCDLVNFQAERVTAHELFALVWPCSVPVLPLAWHVGMRSALPCARMQIEANVVHMAQVLTLRLGR